MLAEMPRGPEEGDEEESGRIKRKVCEARNVSAAEAACLPQLLLALPSSERDPGVKDGGYCFPLYANAVSFVYLSLSAGNASSRLSAALFSGCSFRPSPPPLPLIIPL